jgi:hypothetical protein
MPATQKKKGPVSEKDGSKLRNDGGSSATGKSLPDFGEFICARRACCELIMTKNEISRLVMLSS